MNESEKSAAGLAERIRAARGTRTQAQLAAEAELSRQSIVNYESGQTMPSADALARISKATGASLDYLVWGPQPPAFQPIPENAFHSPPADTSLPPIPVIVLGRAGPEGANPYQLRPIPVDYNQRPKVGDYWRGDGDETLTRPEDVKDITAYAVLVEGDSMLPMLKPGHRVIASPIKQVVNGDAAVVRTRDNQTMIKIVYFEGDFVRLASLNPAYEDLTLPMSDIDFCHAVVWAKIKR